MNDSSPLAQLAALESRRERALREQDFDALEQLLDDTLHYTHASGRQEDKGEHLARLRSGAVRYLACEAQDLRCRPIAGAAELRGVLVADVLVDGQRKALRNFFKSLWVPAGDSWQMISWLSTPLPAPAAQ